jgi:hypothetical protein
MKCRLEACIYLGGRMHMCSYTESLAGYSKVKIFNDRVEVEEKCI